VHYRQSRTLPQVHYRLSFAVLVSGNREALGSPSKLAFISSA
jgi:hypothetical protein